MARARLLSKSISIDEKINELNLEESFIYTWCVPYLDDFGLLTKSPKVIKALVFPMREDLTSLAIEKAFQRFSESGLIETFEDCYYFSGFFKNNTITEDKRALSEFQENRLNKDKSKHSRVPLKPQETPGTSKKPQKVPNEDKISKDKIIPYGQNLSDSEQPPLKKNLIKKEKDTKLRDEAVELIEYWKKVWTKSAKEEPAITTWGRYIKQAMPLVKQFGLKEMKRMCDEYFVTFDDKFIVENKWSIGIFLTDRVINKLRI